MKWFWRIALVVLVLAACGAGGGYYYYRLMFYGALPQTNGELKVAGLQAPVEVLRDQWGIPHLYAENHHDLVFAQGYVQAQDRWWQMEFYRHVSSGRLQELAGSNAMTQKADTLMRTLDLRGVAQRDFDSLDPDLQSYFHAFCDGVNAYISGRKPRELALEYALLEFQGREVVVEPWTPADCLAFGKLMGYTFSGRDLDREPMEAQLMQALDASEWRIWEPDFPYGEHPTTIRAGALPKKMREALERMNRPDLPAKQEASPQTKPKRKRGNAGGKKKEAPGPTSLMDALPQGMPGVADLHASNAWAVSGERTESGRPLFASDPHQGIEIPNLWYEIGLHCPPDKGRPELNLYGYAAPVLPFIQAGHNDHIAWGLTNVSGSDALDLFELRINPENPLQYEWDGEWRNMEERVETIAIAEGDPISLTIFVSHLGPLMPEALLPEGSKDKHYAICWEGLREGSIQRAGLSLVFARNFDEFHEALRHWDYPAANIAYADVEGNIGFQQVGKFPYGKGHGVVKGPMPGYLSEHEWQGFVPYDLLPRTLNPGIGMVVAANQPTVPAEYAQVLQLQLRTPAPIDTAPLPIMGYRAKRIEEMIDATPKHSFYSFANIQNDVTTSELRGALQNVFSRVTLEDSPAKELLLAWDGAFETDSPGAVLAGLFVERFCQNVFADDLPAGVDLSPEMVFVRRLEIMANDPAGTPFWDDASTEPIESPTEMVKRSLTEAWDTATDRFGDDPSAWQWGELHQTGFRNAFLGRSGVGRIEAMVNRLGLAAPGGFSTVNAAGYKYAEGTYEMRVLPSYRQIIDLSDFSKSMAINSTGQSAHPMSPHYDDQLPLWLTGEYRPMFWTREQVEAGANQRLVLQP